MSKFTSESKVYKMSIYLTCISLCWSMTIQCVEKYVILGLYQTNSENYNKFKWRSNVKREHKMKERLMDLKSIDRCYNKWYSQNWCRSQKWPMEYYAFDSSFVKLLIFHWTMLVGRWTKHIVRAYVWTKNVAVRNWFSII